MPVKSEDRDTRSPVTVRVLATLIGIEPRHRPRLRSALASRPIFPIVVMLIACRFRRLTRRLARNVGMRLGNSENGSGVAACKGLALDALALTGTDRNGHDLIQPQASRDGTFPKLIFQTWKSKVSMPDSYSRWSESLRRLNPEFEYILWDDFDNRNFIEKFYSWFLPVFDAYPREIYRADAVRYFFLYQFGGLYADMDSECLRPVAPLFTSGDVWLGRLGSNPDFPHSIPNAIMASRPLQEFWLLVIHLLIENAKVLGDPAAMAGKGPEAMTGPILLKNAHDTYTSSERSAVREMIRGIAARLPAELQPQKAASRVMLLTPDIWYPIDWSNMIHSRLSSEVVDFNLTLGERTKRWLFPTSFLVTYWTHTWKNN